MFRFNQYALRVAALGLSLGIIAMQGCSNSTEVQLPPNDAPVFMLVAAGAHTCGITTEGVAYCWGFNGHGQLGNNDTGIVNPTPIPVAGALRFQSIGVTKVGDFSCGLTVAGAAYCWGDNSGGFLGDGTTTERLVPTPVIGGIVFRTLSVGGLHVCGIAIDGTVWCWGRSFTGAAGNGAAGVPVVVAPGMTFESVVTGFDFSCGLTPNGAAYCWGRGIFGQLGNGSTAASAVPMPVAGGLTFRSLSAGGVAACGLTTAGKAYCWGNNEYGTIGDGTIGAAGANSRRLSPVAVAGDLTFRNINAGYETTCGVTDNAKGYCWGFNLGAVGDGGTDARALPTAVAGGLTFDAIATGTAYGCGITTQKTLFCWGENANGGLGDGTADRRLTPTPVRIH